MISNIPSSDVLPAQDVQRKQNQIVQNLKKRLLKSVDWYNTSVRYRVILITCAFMLILVASASIFGINMYWSDRKAYLFENHQLRAELVFLNLKKSLMAQVTGRPFKPSANSPVDIQEHHRIPRLPENGEIFVGKMNDQLTLFWTDSNNNLMQAPFQFRPEMCPSAAGLCYLATGNGTFLGTSHPHLVTENSFAQRDTLIEAVKGGLRGGFRFVKTGGSNQEAAVTYQEADKTNVYVFIETTTTSIVQQAEQFLRRILILGLLLIVVMSFLLSRIITSILSPIHSLKQSFNRIRKGKYKVDIRHKYTDEFSEMIQDVKVMAETLSDRENTILKVQENLQEIITLTRDLALADTLEQILNTALRGIGKNLGIAETAVGGIALEDDLCELTHLEGLSTVALQLDEKPNSTLERALKNAMNRLQAKSKTEIYVTGPTMLIPVFSADGRRFCTLGLLNTESIVPTNENIHYIRTLTGSIARLLENIIQQMQLKSLMHIESEMKSAASLQTTFLAEVPHVEGWSFDSFFLPASRVGGDWYAYHNDEAARVFFLAIGDATGHGLPSALVSVIACSAFHSLLSSKSANSEISFATSEMVASELINNMNNVIVRASNEKVLMTCLLLAINTETGEVILVNGGHRPPFLRSASGQTSPILAKGDILGLMSAKERQSVKFKLEAGDTLVLYTDGLIENTGPENRTFSGQKFRSAIQTGSSQGSTLLDHLLQQARFVWKDELGGDDVTVITVSHTPAA